MPATVTGTLGASFSLHYRCPPTKQIWLLFPFCTQGRSSASHCAWHIAGLDNGETEAMWQIQGLPKAKIKWGDRLTSLFSSLCWLIPGSCLETETRAWYNVYSATSTVYSDGRNKQSGACLVFSPTPPSLHTTFLAERPSQGPVKGFYHWDRLILKLSQLLPSVAVK